MGACLGLYISPYGHRNDNSLHLVTGVMDPHLVDLPEATGDEKTRNPVSSPEIWFSLASCGKGRNYPSISPGFFQKHLRWFSRRISGCHQQLMAGRQAFPFGDVCIFCLLGAKLIL